MIKKKDKEIKKMKIRREICMINLKEKEIKLQSNNLYKKRNKK